MSILEIDENMFGRTLHRVEESWFAIMHNRDLVKLEDEVMRNHEDAKKRKRKKKMIKYLKKIFIWMV